VSTIWDAFDGGPHELRLGLRPLPPDQWLVLEPPLLHGAELDRKAALLGTHDDVYVCDDHEPARELLGVLLDALVRTGRYEATSTTVTLLDDGRTWTRADFEPLDLAGRLVTEDWCLVRPGRPPVFAAGTVCSPNRWRLLDKVGRPVTDVHDPVPEYRAGLGRPVDAMLGKRGRPMWRRNWSILSSPSRYQPENDGPAQPRIPDEVWVRSEYETFVSLPVSGWWVFGIQTTVRPITEAPDKRAIATAVASLDPAMERYKDLAGWREPLLAWLRAT